jgi:hypothetical protein
VRTEWRSLMTGHNLGNLHRHQLADAAARKRPSGGHTAIHHGHAPDDPPTVARPNDRRASERQPPSTAGADRVSARVPSSRESGTRNAVRAGYRFSSL